LFLVLFDAVSNADQKADTSPETPTFQRKAPLFGAGAGKGRNGGKERGNWIGCTVENYYYFMSLTKY